MSTRRLAWLSLRLGLAAVVPASVFFVACGNPADTVTPSPAATAGSRPTPSTPIATVTLTAEPTAAVTGAVGPFLVYRTPLQHPDDTGHVNYVFGAVVYDVGAQRKYASFQLGEPNEWQTLAVAGDKIVAISASRIVRYDLDGSNPMVLRRAVPGGALSQMAVSRDSQRIALTESRPVDGPKPVQGEERPRRQVSSIVVVDMANAREIAVIPQSEPAFAGFVGDVWKLTWRDDGQGLVVQGATFSERPGGTATVTLDGLVRVHDLRGFVNVSPDGRHAEYGSLSSMPLGGMSAMQSEVVLHDFSTQAELVSVKDENLLFMPWEWSPDGSEFLYSVYASRSSMVWPGYREEDPATERLYLLHVDGSPPEPVTDRETVHERWYGNRHVRLLCLGEVRHYPSCTDEAGNLLPFDIYVGETFVGSATSIEITGVIER